ncbi:MAG: hypothetical protein ACP59X_14310 [Solidesulfovibrio sp. DCME]|uniref:hypothetical protein n=1 Tax=Solidesulfovibrio sp. DCME TaxID=3447380 RepID=UPI003D0A5EFD
MPEAGYRINISTSDGRAEVGALRQSMDSLTDATIREAKRELEDFRNTLSTVGDLMSDLGRLSGSPEASYQGAMLKLKGQYKDASDQAKAMGISQDLVDQAYTLKAREAWQESYKGLTTIDGSAFDARRAMLSREVEDFRKAGADEVALRVYAAQKAEDIARDELQTRQAYAGSFTDFLRGQVNIELGLYQGAHSRELQEWQDYYNDLKQLGQGWMDTTKAGLVDLIDGAVTGKGEDAWKNMLANMRRQFITFAVDLAMDLLCGAAGCSELDGAAEKRRGHGPLDREPDAGGLAREGVPRGPGRGPDHLGESPAGLRNPGHQLHHQPDRRACRGEATARLLQGPP